MTMGTLTPNSLQSQFASGPQANAVATLNPPTQAYRNVVPPSK